jgi:uncharacterized protein YcbX
MRVTQLWQFPVKSMQGERLESVEVGERGLRGDRQWALVDLVTGLALTARREPPLLYAKARLVGDDDVEITLPDGHTAASDAELSGWLGHPVALRRASSDDKGTYEIALDFEHEDTAEWTQWQGPEGSFHDSGRTMVSIVSEASFREWDVRRFRINVVVDGEGGEQSLVGTKITIGGVSLDVVKPIGRCVITTRPQPGGIERNLDVLRTINAEFDGNLGIGALVLTPGPIAVGDELTAD